MRAGHAIDAVDRIGGVEIQARAEAKAPARHVDVVLLATTVALIVAGAVMVYSATAPQVDGSVTDPGSFATRHALYALVGVAALVGVGAFDYRYLRWLAPVAYLVGLVGLAVVLSPLGEEVGGAKRWLDFGSVQVQPSEFAKLATILAVAVFLSVRKGTVSFGAAVGALVLVGLPSGLILVEPDLGTLAVFVFLAVALLLVAGVRFSHLVVFGVIAVLGVIGAAQTGIVKDYQRERLTAFLDPAPDIRSEGYNLTQSKIAIASGGLTGRGLGAENTQTSLAYVPEQHTDFIFTAVGEQLGFVGSAGVLVMLALLIYRALRIAALSRDLFGTLIAAGVAAMWAFQVFVNVGMTMGIMPITGIPLPFLSFGGSALVVNLVAVGLLLNVHMRRFIR